MFLNNLNRNEKIAFITLANELALTNNIIDEFEEKMLNDFKKELELKENVKEISYDEAINIFIDSKNNVKRGVFTELLSISICNNDFEIKQKEILEEIRKKLGLPNEFRNRIEKWVTDINILIKEGFDLIGG